MDWWTLRLVTQHLARRLYAWKGVIEILAGTLIVWSVLTFIKRKFGHLTVSCGSNDPVIIMFPMTFWVHYIEIRWTERQCQNFDNFASEPRGDFQAYSGVSRRNPKIFVQQKNRCLEWKQSKNEHIMIPFYVFGQNCRPRRWCNCSRNCVLKGESMKCWQVFS